MYWREWRLVHQTRGFPLRQSCWNVCFAGEAAHTETCNRCWDSSEISLRQWFDTVEFATSFFTSFIHCNRLGNLEPAPRPSLTPVLPSVKCHNLGMRLLKPNLIPFMALKLYTPRYSKINWLKYSSHASYVTFLGWVYLDVPSIPTPFVKGTWCKYVTYNSFTNNIHWYLPLNFVFAF